MIRNEAKEHNKCVSFSIFRIVAWTKSSQFSENKKKEGEKEE